MTDTLTRLLGYLESDPRNPELLSDAVDAALSNGDLDQAEALNARLAELRPEDDGAAYHVGLIAMRRGNFATAARAMAALRQHMDTPAVRFNLAWSKAMLGEKAEALELLDAETVDAIAAAAMLRVQIIHENGEFDEAYALAKQMLTVHPDDQGLLAAVATLATDMEDMALAKQCAEAAGDHPEGLAVSALIEMEAGRFGDARQLYDRALAVRDHNPRAWIGRGLTALLDRDPAEAARDIDRGAQQFGDHIGSWIAAGWAHCLAGDRDAARQRFEHALAIDPNFAESHGSLAAIDVLTGDTASAKRRVVTALKLDRDCFSAALAQMLLSNGDPEAAKAIVDRAMTAPLNDQGMTIASYMAGLSLRTLH
jgi:tetratricopeptide (TPR) repeat protein